MSDQQTSDERQTINPGMLIILTLLGGGVVGGGSNLLIPKDAPDRYTGSMATHDWDIQTDFNDEVRAKIERLKDRCAANEATINYFRFRFNENVHIPHIHPKYEDKNGE